MEFPMSVSTGEITKITIAPYRGSDKLEASVMMLVGGEEVRRRWKSPHTSRTSTERWAREKARAFLTGRVAREKEPAPMFAEFAVRFVADHVRACRLRPSTAANMQMNIKQHLIPMFGALRVDEITDAHVLEVKMLDLAAGTINKILQALGQILRDAQAKKHVANVPKIKRVKDNNGRHDFYTPDQYDVLVHAAGSYARTLVLVLLAGDAGLRVGEIIALEWSRIDYGANKVHVEFADWEGHIGPPKSGKPRSVPMTPRLRAALQALKPRGTRVLARSEGRYGHEGDPITRNVAKAWLVSAHRRAELALKGVHTLRHTFCSHLAMAGVPVTAIRDLAGHSSVAVTQRYMHLAPAAIVGAIELLAGLHGSAGATSSLEKSGRRDPDPEKN
jgi:integrase